MPTFTCDPMSHPEEPFRYIDISSIDKNEKTIVTTTRILGSEAPSRARKKVQLGDVIVSTVRPNLNAVALVSPQLDGAIASTGFCVLRPKGKILDNKYLFYWTQTQQFISNLMSKTTGAHYPAVSDGTVKNSPIPLPPLSEQRRIVEILDQADALRKKRAKANEKAQRILPALFYKMFGDPATNTKGWPRSILTELVTFIGGGTPSKSKHDYWTGDIPWVSPKDMRNLRIWDTADHISTEAVYESATSIVPKNSILVVVRSGILAHTLPVARTEVDLSLNQDMKALVPKNNDIITDYLLGWFLFSEKDLLGCVKRGATVHSIDIDKLRQMLIPIPPKTIQKRFAEMLNSTLNQQSARLVATTKVEDLFAVLLHRAFTGDLTAKWREAHMNEFLQEMKTQMHVLAENRAIR